MISYYLILLMVLIVIGFEESPSPLRVSTYNIKYWFSYSTAISRELTCGGAKADVQDNQMYYAITFSPPQGIRYMAADCGYDDHKLYNLSITRGFEIVCPVSVEPLIQHIKDIFKIDPLTVRGYQKAALSIKLLFITIVRLIKNIQKQSNIC